MAPLLLLGAELEQHGGARRRSSAPGSRDGVLVAGELLVEHLLVGGGQALAAVLASGRRCRRGRRRRACAGARGSSGDRGQLLLVGDDVAQTPTRDGVRTAQVLPDQARGPAAGSSRASSIVARRSRRRIRRAARTRGRSIRRRCSAGVPNSARFTRDAAQEQVQVVLEGDADAAVHLHAVLHQLGAVVADVRLGQRSPARGRRAAPAATAAAASSLMAWLASSHVFMSAKRCLSAWYDASGRPNEYRSNAHSTVMSNAACMAPDRLGG